MKPVGWVVIISSSVAFILGLVILVTRVFSDPPKSWWWTGGAILFFIIVGSAVGIIFLMMRLRRKQPETIKTAPLDAEERAKNLLKLSDDFPDNFIQKDNIIKMVGEAGKDRTPILWLTGEGSELKQKIDILIKLNDKNKYPLFLFNKKDESVLKAIIEYADNPEKVEVEERTIGRDNFGMPTTIIKTKRMSKAEQQKKEKEEEAQEQNAM